MDSCFKLLDCISLLTESYPPVSFHPREQRTFVSVYLCVSLWVRLYVSLLLHVLLRIFLGSGVFILFGRPCDKQVSLCKHIWILVIIFVYDTIYILHSWTVPSMFVRVKHSPHNNVHIILGTFL